MPQEAWEHSEVSEQALREALASSYLNRRDMQRLLDSRRYQHLPDCAAWAFLLRIDRLAVEQMEYFLR